MTRRLTEQFFLHRAPENALRQCFRRLGLLLALALILNGAIPVLAEEESLFIEPEASEEVIPEEIEVLAPEDSNEATVDGMDGPIEIDLVPPEADGEDATATAQLPVETLSSPESNSEDFQITDGVLEKYLGSGGDVVIPYGVTTIGERAFKGCTSLTNVTIPENVVSIGVGAFWDCNSLASVTIPDSVTSIESDAFVGCDSLTSIAIPGSVANMGQGLFEQCINLTSVTFANGVTNLGNRAFWGCTSLTNVTIPNSVTDLGSETFSGCTSLTDVTIPNSVAALWSKTFLGCTGLTNVTIPNSVTSIGYEVFKNCTSLTDVTIPDSVTSIEFDAFRNCTSLTSVKLPDSVTSIGFGAFKNCTSLTSVTIPDSVTSIEGEAFRECTSLTSVTIPGSIASIKGGTFERCYNLTSVIIQDGVKVLGDNFFECTSLTNITIPSSVIIIADFHRCTNLTIEGDAGSYAETYAAEHGIPFVARTPESVEPVDLIANKITMGVGEEIQIVDPKSPVPASKCRLSSTDKAVVTVSEDGTVTAVGAGTAKVMATIDTRDMAVSSVCEVTVKPAPKSITISEQFIKIGIGETYTLKATLSKGTWGRITWTSSYPSFVAVEADDAKKDAILKCPVVGRQKTTVPFITITARTYNGLEATCKVVVGYAPDSVSLPCKKLTMGVGETYTMKPTLPSGTYSQLSWSTSKKKVATVNASGRIKAKEKGKAKIKVSTYNKHSATCEVEVKAAPKSIKLKSTLKMRPYDTHVLKATLSKGSGAIVKWKSSNNSVATVDENGMMTALKPGEATIKAYTFNKKTAKCKITVSNNNDVKYRALIIGQDDTYKDGKEANFREDAKAMKKVLKKVIGPSGGKWSINDNGQHSVQSSARLLDLINDTFSDATSDDVSLIFISCHATNLTGALQITDKPKNDYLQLSSLADALKKIPGKVVVILASCCSGTGIADNAAQGNASKAKRQAKAFNRSVINAFADVDSGLFVNAQGHAMEAGEVRSNTGELRKVNKFYVLTACGNEEESYYRPRKKEPTFFVQAIKDGVTKSKMPADANKDNIITLQELYEYTQDVTWDKADKESKVQHVQVYPAKCGFGLFKKS
ncbi:MAG: leucine-rich repeat protein [Clostridia bacterium]|nr:leucine-rich repeat protein [Clostridia bacterium]